MARHAHDTSAVADAISEIARQAANPEELLSDRVAVALQRQILSGRLPAGAKLPNEDDLCEVLGVSRSVVRDAVRTLVARGLITVRQGRGTAVAVPSDEAFSSALLVLLARSGLSMGDVVEARATIETRLVGLAAQSGSAEDWAELEGTYDRFARAVEDRDDAVAAEAHSEFHLTILESLHQPALSLFLKPMTEIILVSSTASIRGGSPQDWEVRVHGPILDALKAGDPEAAERAMLEHFEVSTRPSPYRKFLERTFGEAIFEADGAGRHHSPPR